MILCQYKNLRIELRLSEIMQPIDKFGNKIYENTYNKMLHFGDILLRFGYKESRNKANLFFKKSGQDFVFFADMRGTDTISIWEDPSPLLYATYPESMPKWERRRVMEQEHASLGIGRFSFYDECEPDGLFFGQGGDGYCIVCHKDFGSEGLFCSTRCEQAYEDMGKERCSVCGKELPYDKLIQHHIDYPENKTITVCRSCHSRIHKSSSFKNLKPK
jgi:hypothetical protein